MGVTADPRIIIGKHEIGFGSDVFIIAEAGVNHNGEVGLAKDLIEKSCAAGAHCVKFQTFSADEVVTHSAPKAAYQLKVTDRSESQLEMLRRLELPRDAYAELIRLCERLDVCFLSTPYNLDDVDFLNELGVAAFKLASIHIAEPFLLDYVARKNKPVILSTGMATFAEVSRAVEIFRNAHNEQLILLQCTTNYPSRLADANLRAISTMRDAFGVAVGYSDHTPTNTACIVAVGLGACVIEKHFTVDKTLWGPDQSTSADPEEFRCLVKLIAEASEVLGDGRKAPCEAEFANMKGMRRSVVARRKIVRGEAIRLEDLTFRRPATGIEPADLSNVLGRTAACDIQPDQVLMWDMIDGRR